MPEKRMISLGISPDLFPEGQHICYIYNDDQERLEVMAKYLKSGKDANEKLLYLVDVMTSEEMFNTLEDMGVDFKKAKIDDIHITDAAPAYCPSGFFKTEEMLNTVKEFYLNSINEGYDGSRGTGEMSWCLIQEKADYFDLMEYEAKLTGLLKKYPYTACCQYDARKFDGQTILDVMKVHPVMIVQGRLVTNPYYIEPEEFLKELKKRKAHA